MKKTIYILMFMMMGITILMLGTTSKAYSTSEQTAHISDPEFKDLREAIMAGTQGERANSRNFSLSVAPAARYVSGYIGVSKGGYISVAANCSLSARVGIMDADGNVRYVTGTNVNHSFSISKTYSYCVFVQNIHNSTITVNGMYSWN